MGWRMWLSAAVAAAGVSLCSAGAVGQVNRPVHAVQLFNQWTFEPVLIGGEVKAFIAHADPDTLVGDNLPILWYEKQADGSWSMWGWSSYDLGGAVMWLREYYTDPNLLHASPNLCCVVTPTTALSMPKPMTDGVYVDDPIHQLIVTAEDPVATVSLLEVIGWEAAPLLSTMAVATIDDCIETGEVPAIDQMLNETAHKLELVLVGTAITVADCFSGCTGCVKNYDQPVATPGSSWILVGESTPAATPNIKKCFWDRAGTQRVWESGQKTDCSVCTGDRTVSFTIKDETTVGRNDECTSPPQ